LVGKSGKEEEELPRRWRPGKAQEDDMRNLYRSRRLATKARAALAQVGRAFEVLVERQYFAPWNQLASRDCRDC
jgi:hypothetical protein